jgi:hypothetical protein
MTTSSSISALRKPTFILFTIKEVPGLLPGQYLVDWFKTGRPREIYI